MSPVKGIAVLMVMGLVAFHGEATIHYKRLCPKEFVGKVVEVKDVKSQRLTDQLLAKKKVKLEVLKSIKGNVPEYVSFEVLKHGELNFLEGAKYHVSYRKSWPCVVKKKDN